MHTIGRGALRYNQDPAGYADLRKRVAGAIETLGAGASGGASRPGEGSMTRSAVQVLIDDMTTPNAVRPHGIDADWAKGPRIGQGDTWPAGWTCATQWGQIYFASEGSPAVNVRIQVREPAYWVLSRRDGRWHRLQYAVTPEGAAYREDFANDENVAADARKEPDGSVSVRLLPGHNYHFWPSNPGRVAVEVADVGGQVAVFYARLVVDDPRKADDRPRARLIGSCGGDHWRALGVPWKADWSNNGDWAIGRFKPLTPEWQAFTACSLPADAVRRTPPPVSLEPAFDRPKRPR